MSFGFKYGVPRANYYFDVGFLKNPSREKNWSFFSNPDAAMNQFIMVQPQAMKFMELVVPLLRFLSDIDQNQIFAFGCSAGRHRSNILVEEIAKRLTKEGINVNVVHRDL
jgi:UPF0042 nucleotide-binding protein